MLTSLAMFLLIAVLNLPMGVWKNQGPVQSSSVQSQAAGILPSSTPAANDKAFEPPVGSALFEISGKKYYMPLPLDRNKERAYAVETTAGILWSPPPPMVDYKKPKYTHPTEPFTLYLSSKDQTELSASSATKVYTLPLFASGVQSYNDLIDIYSVDKYVILLDSTYTLGASRNFKPRMSVIDMSKFVKGEAVRPKGLFAMDTFFNLEDSAMAIDRHNEEILVGSSNNKARLYDIESGDMQELNIVPRTDISKSIPSIIFEVKGKTRSAELINLNNKKWFFDQWFLNNLESSYSSR